MDDGGFSELVRRIGEFHVTDRSMLRAQRAVEAVIASGDLTERERRAYLDAAQRYFSGFEREARAHLRDVDRRLEAQNQVVFNLTAERGVAVKRIEVTQSVLAGLRALQSSAT
jgi:hypothetical protein